MTFDIRQLRYAIAVADHGSFHRAAEAMEVEQSTLSRNVLKLERLIGVKIFDRSHAGTTLTIAGRQFIRRARPMVACADKLASIMRATRQGHAGSLTIGHNSSISAGNLRGATLGWHNVHPEVDLGGMEADRGALLAGLDTGEIDIAILMGEVIVNVTDDGLRMVMDTVPAGTAGGTTSCTRSPLGRIVEQIGVDWLMS
jgi:DNA-binding transcriptional LysR family regulator